MKKQKLKIYIEKDKLGVYIKCNRCGLKSYEQSHIRSKKCDNCKTEI